MANYKITELTSIDGDIDRTTDVVAVVDTSANETKKGTINQLLSITGAPLGDTDSQTVSNKTLGNTNIVTIKDGSSFTIQNASDTTKQARIDASGITTGTTRTYALPDANTTLVGIGTTQTLTNKTLTSPVINTATISNPTLTVDTVSEYSAANGVTVDGLNIKDAVLNTNNSVVTANITDAAVTPAKLMAGTGSSWVWQNWTPSYGGFSVGNGTVVAKYCQMGKTVHAIYSLTFGGTTSLSATGSANTISLPVTSSGNYVLAQAIGNGHITDAGTSDWVAVPQWLSTTTFNVFTSNSNADPRIVYITSAKPMTWTTSDILALSLTYEAA